MKHIHYYIMSALAATALMGCSDDIKPEDRLIYVEPAEVKRAVLIEDFTGQTCVNCPYATDVIEDLIAQYGDTAVIAVGIHSGPFGFAGNDNFLGLMTDLGNTYYNHFQISSQPAGVIDRKTVNGKYEVLRDQWPALVKNELNQSASLSIALDNAYDEATRTVTITTAMEGQEGTTDGMLQLWLTEDSIVAVQYLPNDGVKYPAAYDLNYLHQHVFRDAVNGDWGEDVSVKRGETLTTTHTYTLKDGWEAKNLSVVAFVYDANGVLQVTKKRIK